MREERTMKKLVLATDGCCAGHLCDNCPTCRRGRCCRRDHPGYHLPELGDWNGPIYGELGVLEDDGIQVICHCCGRGYQKLGNHILWAHDLTSAEYRAIFGLNATAPLAATAYRNRERLLHAEQLRAVRYDGRFTPEQRAAFDSRHRLQTRKALIGHPGKVRTLYVPCAVCGEEMARIPSHIARHRTCSDACANLLRSRTQRSNG